ncbi:MAG: ribosome silencing factor [Spirochaetes bacterium]|nr:ribosome silencing factor [Spirochaetota bacterium]
MREMTAPKEKGSREELAEWVKEIAEFLRDRKARDILVLDLEGMTSIADYFIICTVTSSVQTKALIRDLESFMKEYDVKSLSRNTSVDSPWVLLDYNFFIIHLFLQEGRDYYRLEKLWSDAEVICSFKGGIL